VDQRQVVLTVIWVTIGCGMAVGIAIGAVVCWFLAKWLRRVPEEHRRLTPGSIWLLLVPVFGCFWNFMVYPRIADSFDGFFRSRSEAAPSARGLATAYCWTVAALVPVSGFQIALNPVYRGEAPSFPPPLLLGLQAIGGLLSLAALVLWILLLVRFHGLQKRIPAPVA